MVTKVNYDSKTKNAPDHCIWILDPLQDSILQSWLPINHRPPSSVLSRYCWPMSLFYVLWLWFMACFIYSTFDASLVFWCFWIWWTCGEKRKRNEKKLRNQQKWETSFFFGWREKREGGKCRLYKLTIMSLLYNSGKVRGIQNPGTRIWCVFCFWTIVNFGYHNYLLFGQVKNF